MFRHSRSVLQRGTRALHAGSSAKSGGYDYEHAPHMYNLGAMKNRGLKFGLGITTCVVAGCAIPWVAVQWQFKKAQG